MDHPKIIAVTGTKGKSSVVQLLASVLGSDDTKCLRVDTTGAYLGEHQISSVAETMHVYHQGPAISPGRYLLLASKQPDWSGEAVLECSIGCYKYGLGYKNHHIGIFTNIYNDHLSKNLPTREDLVKAKSFIAERVIRGGTLIYNADEPLIVAVAKRQAGRITTVSVGLTDAADWTVKDNKAIYQSEVIFDLTELPWLIDISNIPYVYNALFVAAALHTSGVSLRDLPDVMKQTRLDNSTGRMELLGSSDDVRILLSFAHEKVSLNYVSALARKLAGKNKIMAVVRSRTSPKKDQLMYEFAAACNDFDRLVIYEKTLTYQPTHMKAMGPVLQEVFKEQGREVPYIPNERAALQSLKEVARPGDVVVHIINGDTGMSRRIAVDLLT